MSQRNLYVIESCYSIIKYQVSMILCFVYCEKMAKEVCILNIILVKEICYL